MVDPRTPKLNRLRDETSREILVPANKWLFSNAKCKTGKFQYNSRTVVPDTKVPKWIKEVGLSNFIYKMTFGIMDTPFPFHLPRFS